MWEKRLYTCTGSDNDCEIDKTNRNRCRLCRFHKCLIMGMDAMCELRWIDWIEYSLVSFSSSKWSWETSFIERWTSEETTNIKWNEDRRWCRLSISSFYLFHLSPHWYCQEWNVISSSIHSFSSSSISHYTIFTGCCKWTHLKEVYWLIYQESCSESMVDTVDNLCSSMSDLCRVDVPFTATMNDPGICVKRTTVSLSWRKR